MAHTRFAGAAALLVLTALTANADVLGNLTVEDVVAAEGGIYLTLSPAPAACSGGVYKTAHAFIPSSAARFHELYALAINARAIGKLVTITYTDRGNCQQAATTLFLTDLE